MTATSPRDGSSAAAVCAALAPYTWRKFTPERLARLVLAAHDRHVLAEMLDAVAGAEVGPWAPTEPTDADDPRLPALVEFLAAHRWTELTLRSLCVRLLAVLPKAT
jgi:hypothetical protein